jgi:hypothetical protein
LRKLFQLPRSETAATADVAASDSDVIAAWEKRARGGSDPVRAAACRALARAASALFVRHGRIWGSRETIAALALDLAANAYSSEVVGRAIEPLFAKAVAAEHFTILPPQDHPVVMNTKGASASGKSTLRPRQRKLAGELDVHWSEFAIIGPTSGATASRLRRSGRRTSGGRSPARLQIIDRKLDCYMARKTERGK